VAVSIDADSCLTVAAAVAINSVAYAAAQRVERRRDLRRTDRALSASRRAAGAMAAGKTGAPPLSAAQQGFSDAEDGGGGGGRTSTSGAGDCVSPLVSTRRVGGPRGNGAGALRHSASTPALGLF